MFLARSRCCFPSQRLRLWIAGLLCCVVAVGAVIAWRQARGPKDHFQGGLAALHAGDLGLLKDELSALRGRPGHETQVHLLEGALWLRIGRPTEALIHFKASGHDPQTRVQALTLAGEAYHSLGRFAEAESVLKTVLLEAPEEVAAHRWLAATYYDVGATANAFPHLEHVARLAPLDGRPHRLMGLIHKDMESYSRAVAAYRESLRRNPHPPDEVQLRMELAECLAATHAYREALELLATVAISPQSLALQARCQFRLGNQRESAELMSAAVEAAPNDGSVLLEAGTLAQDSNDLNRAAELLRRAVQADPHDYTARFKLVQVYRRRGMDAEAEIQVPFMRENQQRRERFSRLHGEAEKHPRDASIRYQMGLEARDFGKPELARLWFRAALMLDPRHEAARHALADLPK